MRQRYKLGVNRWESRNILSFHGWMKSAMKWIEWNSANTHTMKYNNTGTLLTNGQSCISDNYSNVIVSQYLYKI